jgi:hypothetical protein
MAAAGTGPRLKEGHYLRCYTTSKEFHTYKLFDIESHKHVSIRL